MTVLMMGGRIAPSPSLPSRRSRIQVSAVLRAFPRSGVRAAASIVFRVQLAARKKVVHRRCRIPPARRRGLGGADGPRSSWMFARSGTGQDGFRAQMIERGTTMALDQEEIR